MASRYVLCGFVAALLVALPAAAQNRVLLETPDFHADFASSTRFLEDRDHTLSASEAADPARDKDYQHVTTRVIDFGFTKSKFWLKIPVENIESREGEWKLTHDNPMPDPLEVYLIDESEGRDRKPELIYSITLRDPFSYRQEGHRHHVSTIKLAAGQKATLLIAHASNQTMQIPLSIESVDRFYQRTRLEDIHILGLLAVICGMALISVIYLAALGLRTAYYYGAYILTTVVNILFLDGYGFQYLWPNNPSFNSLAMAPLGFVNMAMGNMLAWSFIGARKNHPVLNVLLLLLAALLCLWAAMAYWGITTVAYKTLGLVFALFAAPLPTIAAYFAWRRGHPAALLYMSGTLALAVVVAAAVSGYLNRGLFNQDIVGHVARYALLYECIAFALAIFVRTQIFRSERDAALRNEVELSSEKLALSEALRMVERDYSQAKSIAERRRHDLASTVHDIRQPLGSLRLSLMRLNKNDKQAASQLQQSFEYLEGIITRSLDSSTGRATETTGRNEPRDALPDRLPVAEVDDASSGLAAGKKAEVFAANVVLRNIEVMFIEDAEEKGCNLKLMPCSQPVKARPLELMRILSNLVANAVNHSGAARIVIGCRRSGDVLSFEVHDNGVGMDEDQQAHLLRPNQKGDRSTGYGLGLGIAQELAKSNGFCFRLQSVPGAGTVFKISVPVGC